MDQERPYSEEEFGILTDDDIYLDCILVKPRESQDEDLRALRVWVPRYPLNKSSVITCARQEVQSYGSEGTIAHLVFDLRGTGESEGRAGDRNFEMDLQGIRLWAQERFGDVSFGFLGVPNGGGQVEVHPIRPGVVIESYHYAPRQAGAHPAVIYLATFGNFGASDDAYCSGLAAAGYEVYGMDPLRYLLHASASGRLQVKDLWQDLREFIGQLGQGPLLVGQPVSAGLALLWASGVEAVQGVLAIGHLQLAFKPRHIFANDNPHTFFLSRYVHRLAPRPLCLVLLEDDALGGIRDELAAIYQTSSGPRQLEQVEAVTSEDLLRWLQWLEQEAPQ